MKPENRLYMEGNGNLIFRFDNVPYHPQLSTFPHHKHDKNKTAESGPVDLKKVVEEIIDYVNGKLFPLVTPGNRDLVKAEG
jgi:hypothetical protein